MERQIHLSKRLKMLADMVSEGKRVADVGCDHGYLPIFLMQQGRIPGALAMDVRKGPLKAAREHIASCRLEDYIECRLSDGLKAYIAGEADTIICAGMGGRLMERILTEGMDKAKAAGELILQPQSEIGEFRKFLRENDFFVVQEEAVQEDGKYYFAMRAVPPKAAVGTKVPEAESREAESRKPENPEEQEVYDTYGKLLLESRNLVLQEYLQKRLEVLDNLKKTTRESNTEKARERYQEISRELFIAEQALAFYEKE